MKKILIFLILAVAAYLTYRYFVFGYGSSFSGYLRPTNMFGFGSQPVSYDAITGITTFS